MISFANGVKLSTKDVKNVYTTGRKQFTFSNEPGALKPSLFEQKTAYRYRLSSANQWIVEVARYDTYNTTSELPTSTNWAASMFNSDWDSTTSQNVVLGIGQRAAWDTSLETFFPTCDLIDKLDTGSRVVDLLQSVRLVSNFLDDMRK